MNRYLWQAISLHSNQAATTVLLYCVVITQAESYIDSTYRSVHRVIVSNSLGSIMVETVDPQWQYVWLWNPALGTNISLLHHPDYNVFSFHGNQASNLVFDLSTWQPSIISGVLSVYMATKHYIWCFVCLHGNQASTVMYCQVSGDLFMATIDDMISLSMATKPHQIMMRS